MGLLTNPNADDGNKLLQLLRTRNGEIGILSYIISLVWVLFLANSSYNLKTHFSENALLPGLVFEHFDDRGQVSSYLSELTQKENSPGGLSPEDVASIFHKIGISETEKQNFTLIHPVFSLSQVTNDSLTEGVNVFGVLRAKRGAGTESIIFNAPYFSKRDTGRRNVLGIAVMLSLAEYFQDQVYWAKDIIFLVSENHIGSLAWVKGHQEIRDENNNLLVENVHTKVGNIQVAVNLVLDGSKVCSMETKYHGLNGQLPNLDLVNLLNKFVFNVRDYDRSSNWEDDIWKMIAYLQNQATGTPTGSHGFFLRYGIESVTLFGKSGNCRRPSHFADVGRVLEATFRSLNNLLERFHQSYFFYLKTSSNRFVSIGLYFPPLALVLLSIPLKAAAIWLTEPNLETTQGLFYLAIVHFVAIGFRWMLSHLELVLPSELLMGLTPELFTLLILGIAVSQFLFVNLLLRLRSREVRNAVYCFVLLELGVSLYTLGLFNPSLVILLGIVFVPFATMFFIFHPTQQSSVLYFGVCTLVTLGLSYILGAHLQSNIIPTLNKYFYESEVYGNFLFDICFTFLFPIFCCIVAVI